MDIIKKMELLSEKISLKDIDIDTVLADLHEGVIIADSEGTVLYYNVTQSHIDEIDIEFALGKKITDLYRLSENTSTTMRCIRTGKPVRNHVIMYHTRTGKVANTISNVFPIFKDKEVIGAISFTKDYQMLENIVSIGNPTKKTKKNDNGTRFTFKDLIGTNRDLLNGINTAKLAADSPSPIMLSGETGTGKELFAQSIHNFSASSKKKFIPINCSAIPENLLEGILFGTSRGAFTGSIDKAGLFEQANGGTIFLDELDSMPPSLQAKVLRVIQEKKVRRLGSLQETNLNIKILSAVGRDPDTIIKSGALRLDLFYRMGVVFILIPPLRKRMDDMDILIDHFVHKFNEALGERVIDISPRVRAIFEHYSWPGNVRELEHVIEGAMNIVNGESTIRLSHLPGHVFNLLKASGILPEKPFMSSDNTRINGLSDNFSDNDTIPAENSEDFFPSTDSESCENGYIQKRPKKLTLYESQSANEKEHICSALKSTNGNAAKAARLLGISPQAFHYKVKKYGIDKKKLQSENSD